MFARNIIINILLFGLTSGFTLMASGNTINYWLAAQKIDIRLIGLFSIIALPYAVNFLLAPIFDIVSLGKITNILGQRKAWLCLIQILVSIFMLILGQFEPKQENILLFSCAAFALSSSSAAKDSILGAMRSDIVAKNDQGAISGMYIFAYRVGMMIASSGAIYLSIYITWQEIYIIFAFFNLALLGAILFLYDDENNIKISKYNLSSEHININFLKKKKYIFDFLFINKLKILILKFFHFFYAVISPIGNITLIITILLFLILYKLPDNFLNTMINPFLITIGYEPAVIASIGKFCGMFGAILGGFGASHIMKKLDIYRSLMFFGVIHAVSHLLLIIQYLLGKNIFLLLITISAESITSGMVMSAYIAFMSSICEGKYKTTQYAIFSSMMGISRSIFPIISGYLVSFFGWIFFFFFVIISSLPSLFLIFKIKRQLKIDNIKN